MDGVKKIKFVFRLVHIKNIPHILKYGIVRSSSANMDPDYIPIGDNTLIESRREQMIPHSEKRIGDFIPFYFGPRSPMLYTIQHGFNGVNKQSPEDLVYCVIRIADVIQYDMQGYFTDGHARNVRTQFYPITQLADLNKLVHYVDVFRERWSNEDDNTGEWKRLKSAELLLENDLETKFICGFVVYNQKAKNELVSFGIESCKIEIRPNYYF